MVKINAIKNQNSSFRAQQIRPMQVEFAAPKTMLPQGERNYCLFNKNKVDFFIAQGKAALPYVKHVLETSKDEEEIVEALYITDRLLDKGTKGIPRMYPLFAKFNDTKSPNIQVYLAGIYRKTQVPDAFGPLMSMLIKNSKEEGKKAGRQEGRIFNEQKDFLEQNRNSSPEQLALLPSSPPALLFDPNEEIGGAILSYIENYSGGKHPQIDFSA